MKTGTYANGTLVILEGDTTKAYQLEMVSLTIHSANFAEVTFYQNGKKEPANKRSLFIPATSIVSFTGYGYAN